MLITERTRLAIVRATTAHEGSFRKGSGDRKVPVSSHLFGAGLLVDHFYHDAAGREDIGIATLLHDTLEDVPDRYPEEKIVADFGRRVLALVKGVTEPKGVASGERISWIVRKHADLGNLATTIDLNCVFIRAAETADNVHASIMDHEEDGIPSLFRFAANPQDRLWYYEAVHRVAHARLGEHPLVNHLHERNLGFAAIVQSLPPIEALTPDQLT